MRRITTLLLLSATVHCAHAQSTPATPKVVKSDPVGMPATQGRETMAVEPASVVGDVDQAPAHPECGERTGQAALDCTAEKVGALIRQQAGKPALDLVTFGSAAVTVIVTVDQYGFVKSVRSEHPGDPGLQDRVMVALYSVPRFTPGTKGDAGVGATLRLGYRYSDLFAQP